MLKRHLLLVIAGMWALAACGSGASSANTSAQSVRLEESDLAFDQTRLEVNANQPVRLTIKNAGALEHDFSILEIAVKDVEITGEHAHAASDHQMTVDPDLHILLEAGSTGMIVFTPTAAGEYEFFCTVAGHKEAGMVGTLVVK